MIIYLIIGRNIEFDVIKLQKIYAKNNNSLNIYQEELSALECSALRLSNNARVIIYADGSNKDIGHVLELCSLHQNTSNSLKDIAAGKVVNIELFSCYGGAAVNAIKKMAIGSTLITFVDRKHILSMSMQAEISLKIASVTKTDNPFIQFARYILLNPDSNGFAIKTSNSSRIFTSSIVDLKNYSLSEVEEWQKKQLSAFAEFCHEIKTELPQETQAQLEEAFNLLGSNEQLSDFTEEFDTIRYRELLLINLVRNGDLQAIKKIVASGVNIDANLSDGATALSLAAHTESPEVVEFLLDNGASINSIPAPLHMAAKCGNIELVELLYSRGAKLDIVDSNGATPLMVAICHRHEAIVKFLCSKAININACNKLGATALALACVGENIKIVKLLLAAGVDSEARYQGKKLVEWDISKEIINEIKIFRKSPVKYILKENDNAEQALLGLKRLEELPYVKTGLVKKIHQTEECLRELDQDQDFNALCGENSTWYTDNSE